MLEAILRLRFRFQIKISTQGKSATFADFAIKVSFISNIKKRFEVKTILSETFNQSAISFLKSSTTEREKKIESENSRLEKWKQPEKIISSQDKSRKKRGRKKNKKTCCFSHPLIENSEKRKYFHKTL